MPNGPNGLKPKATPTPRPARWGVRTLFWLVVALLSILASSLQGAYTVLTLGGLLIGLGGAMYSSVRGMAVFLNS
jgi:hypothetical protein